MKAYGSLAPRPYSTNDDGPPLPKTTTSHRDIFTDIERAHTARAIKSPIILQDLTPESLSILAERAARAVAPRTRRTPAPRLPRVDIAQIITLYTSGLTAPQVAAHLGCSHTTVYAQLRHAGMVRRNDRANRQTPRVTTPQETTLDIAAVLAAYEAGQSPPQIAARFNTYPKTIRRHLRASGVQLRDDRAGHSGGNGKRVDTPAMVDQLRDLYVDQGHSIAETAALMGTSPKVIQTALARNRIPARKAAPRVGVDNAADLKALMAANSATAANVRGWAATTGRPCPTRGLPPRHLVETYLLLQHLNPARKAIA